jgi:hypothetical protein
MPQIISDYPFIVLSFVVLLAFFVIRKIIKLRKRVYKPKGPYLLSFTERKFFEALVAAVGPTLYVCPKVRIADLVTVDIPQENREFWVNFRKISQKHVDFVVCKRSNFSPVLIVELDGGSHREKRQNLRDILVNRVFDDADIPVLHYSPERFYERSNLKEVIFAAMQKKETY